MRESVMCLSMAVMILSGCESKKTTLEHSPIVAIPDTNVAFTPPEIRRTRDSSADVAAPPAAKVPVDSAKASPVPAAVPPANPTPSVAPVAAATVPKPAPQPSQAAPPVSTPIPTPSGISGPTSSGDWTIQVGIHKSEEGARKLAAKLRAQGIASYVVQAAAEAGLSGSYWRVRVGYFPGTADARAYGEHVLKPAGYSYWVDRKSNEAGTAGGTP